MKKWLGREQPLDLTSRSHIRNAMRLTQARRRLFNDLIGIREKREITQAQVARAIGIDRSGVSRFEADIETSNPTVDVILRYAHAVGAAIHMWAEPVEDAEARMHDVWYRGHLSPMAPHADFVVSARQYVLVEVKRAAGQGSPWTQYKVRRRPGSPIAAPGGASSAWRPLTESVKR